MKCGDAGWHCPRQEPRKPACMLCRLVSRSWHWLKPPRGERGMPTGGDTGAPRRDLPRVLPKKTSGDAWHRQGSFIQAPPTKPCYKSRKLHGQWTENSKACKWSGPRWERRPSDRKETQAGHFLTPSLAREGSWGDPFPLQVQQGPGAGGLAQQTTTGKPLGPHGPETLLPTKKYGWHR